MCKIGGTPLTLLIDSGSKVNIIAGNDWNLLKQKKAAVWNINTRTDNILKPYAAERPLEVKYQFDTTVSVAGTAEVITSFYVVEKGETSILGKETAKQLGILKLGLNINHVETKAIIFPKIRNLTVKLTIDPSVKPVRQPLR